MGTILNAECKECGFSRGGLFFGQGMTPSPARIPALRKDNGELTEAAIFDDPNLRFYHSKEMYKGGLGEDEGIQSGDIYLSPDNNLCPSCGSFNMSFLAIGDWD